MVVVTMASEAGAGGVFSRRFTAGEVPQSVVVADLDGDRVPDIVTANADGNDVSVLRGNGDGSFQARVAYLVGDAPESIVVADLDGDGLADLVTANPRSDDVTVLLNLSDPAPGPVPAASASSSRSSRR